MMTIRVRCVKIDEEGFNGRTAPPAPPDIGVEGVVTNIEYVPDEDPDPVDYSARAALAWGQTAPGYQVFYVILDNGDHVELMGHELELISCTHDGDL